MFLGVTIEESYTMQTSIISKAVEDMSMCTDESIQLIGTMIAAIRETEEKLLRKPNPRQKRIRMPSKDI